MSSSFADSFDQLGDDSLPSAASTRPFADDDDPFDSFDGEYVAVDGPILPPPSEMEHEEGFALREWRRL